jgi:hypothetical protein
MILSVSSSESQKYINIDQVTDFEVIESKTEDGKIFKIEIRFYLSNGREASITGNGSLRLSVVSKIKKYFNDKAK